MKRTSHTTGSNQIHQWDFSFDPPPLSLLERFATWYWIRVVLNTGGERCLCKLGLHRLCWWLEERAR